MKGFQLMAGLMSVMALGACGGADRAQDGSNQTGTTPVRQAAKPQVRMVGVPAGTMLSLALDQTLSSATSNAGDTFSATVVEPIVIDGRAVIPGGSRLEGRVTEATAARKGAGKGTLTLSFGALSLPSGYHTNVVGSLQEVSASKKGRDAAIIGGSAAGGALLGQILGKDTKGTMIGAIVGGGVGTAVVMSKEGTQAIVPADTPFAIRLEQAIQVPQVAA